MLSRLVGAAACAAAGAAGMYLLDPRLGRARRSTLRDRAAAALRRRARRVEKRVEYAAGRAEGLRHATNPEEPPPNDETLKHKVESEVITHNRYPKGSIEVTVADGVVELRGVCQTPEQIRALESEVAGVTGVREVRSFLHLPDTPAPNK